VSAGNQPLIVGKQDSGEPYKLGIFGCGNRSKAHISVLNGIPEIEIAALCDIVPHKMDQRAKLIRERVF
jgi:predicted dehydrogenase